MEKKVPYFCVQVPVTIQEKGVHGLRLHEGTSKKEDLFESLTQNVSVCKPCAGVNIGPENKIKLDNKMILK